uniref:DDHD domain-containing protein n=1 Tax=Ciona savignyi TaxID=51511 RepID=H2Y8N2_CIOSA
MLIKEYRIPMPLSVQEYRIAQLYMIQKKSREESQGTESGVEIIQNKPYEDGPGGSGQYTQKIYHISKHIPGWLVAILPKDALIVEEEAWNAYPYTRTRYTCPFIEKFSIDIETRYFDDTGEKENVFDLPKSDFGRRIVDEIDLVNEQSSDYKKEEDPRHYVSKKTGRGPLSEDWLSIAKKSSPKSRGNFMCAYKQCKVEFKYWGMQSKIEKFIHDTGLRKVMLRAHKQAWCWQDEWHGLTINDIRRLEKETQLALQIKFGVNTSDSDNTLDLEESENNVENNSFSQTNLSSRQTGKKVLHKQSSNISSHSNHSKHSSLDGKHFNFYWEINNILKAVLKCSDISSDDEFFDAQGKFVCLLRLAAHSKTKTSTCFIIFYTDSLRSMVHENSLDHELLLDQVSILKYRRKVINIIMLYFFFVTNNVFQHYSANPCQVSVLLLVLHGGNGLEASNQGLHSTKQSDVHTLQSTLEAVMKSYYKSVYGRLAVRLVSCPAICTEAYHLLQRLIPTSHNDSTQHTISSAMLSIFGTSSPKYMDTIRLLACSCNFVYNNFILSSEGKGFNGQVCIISDTMGSVLAYDLLCSAASNDSSRRNSSLSYHEVIFDFLFFVRPQIQEEEDCRFQSVSEEMSSPTLRVLGPPKWDFPQPNPVLLSRRGSALPSLGGDSKFALLNLTCKSSSRFLLVLSISQAGNHHHHRNSPPRQISEPLPSISLSQLKLDFEVSELFMLGSPLGIVLAMRHANESHDNAPTPSLKPPLCRNVYNLFYPADPSSARIEPLLDPRFSNYAPSNVPKYHLFPLGDGQSISLGDILSTSREFTGSIDTGRRSSEWSVGSGQLDLQLSGNLAKSELSNDNGDYKIIVVTKFFLLPRMDNGLNISKQQICLNTNTANMLPDDNSSMITHPVASHWWGEKRIDFSLFSPDVIGGFPSASLPHLFHSSFWESADVAAFLLRQIFQYEHMHYQTSNNTEIQFTQTFPTEKWLRKRTNVKLRNLTANHRCRDSVALECTPQVLVGRFMYGPLDMLTLTGEKVDIYIMTPPPASEWVYMDTEICNNSGKVTYNIPESKSLTQGLYPVKMIVRGDHTSADSNLAVLCPQTECVIFSIDGSFTASMSIMGSDPKVRPGAVDVVRLWQDLGYLIIYVTGRPDMQKHRVVTWLAQHNFPHGMIWFGDGLSKDPLKQKTILLKNLKTENKLIYAAGYGSSKDIAVYSQLDIEPDRIFIVGKVSKKQSHQ